MGHSYGEIFGVNKIFSVEGRKEEKPLGYRPNRAEEKEQNLSIIQQHEGQQATGS